jgi:hypothetical protein
MRKTSAHIMPCNERNRNSEINGALVCIFLLGDYRGRLILALIVRVRRRIFQGRKELDVAVIVCSVCICRAVNDVTIRRIMHSPIPAVVVIETLLGSSRWGKGHLDLQRGRMG